MSHRIQIEEEVTYDPPEAHAAARVYRSAASEVRTVAQQVRSMRGSLEETWFGNAKNIFFGNSEHTAANLDRHASTLEGLAREAEEPVTVIKLVWVWVDEEDV